MSEANPIEDLVQAAMDQNFNKANEVFGELMGVKVADALDQEKIAVANAIYNPTEEDDADDEDLDLTDDEIEAELDDAVDEFNSEDDEVEN